MTKYKVYRLVDGNIEGGTWNAFAHYDAHGPEQAVRQALAEFELDHGTFAAVPERSWHEITVATETQTRLVFGKPALDEMAKTEPEPEPEPVTA